MDFYGNSVVFEILKDVNTREGIYIPDNIATTGSTTTAIVTQLGIGKPNHVFTVKIGDKIVIPNGESALIEADNKKYRIIDEEKILAILD